MEAEAHGEGETLARHEKILLELAKKRNYNVTQIYREIVSGETIAARPVMQQLLQEVEEGLWEGVIVMEVERLARGDTIDQGIMAQTFKYSETLIITPMKIYDPNNEYDEEYFEFGLFMSRREYKTINRRLQRGRASSTKEGKYTCGRKPYGYKRVHVQNDKGWTLEPIKEEADIVRLIFKLYTEGKEQPDGSFRPVGCGAIGSILDKAKIPPPQTAPYWAESSIRNILGNPLYIGKVRWNTSKTKKRLKDGIISLERIASPPEEQIIVNGLHKAIVDEETFYKAQDIMKSHETAPVHRRAELRNPLAGVLRCGKCGRAMVLRGLKADNILCPNKLCKNVMSKYSVVEERVLQSLQKWLDSYQLNWESDALYNEELQMSSKRKAISKAQKELETLTKQFENIHNLLEQGIYDTDMFLERNRFLTERMNETKAEIKELSRTLSDDEERAASRINIIPKVKHLLDVYSELPDAQSKNDMLKDVIEHIDYTKEKPSPRNGPYDNFELVLYPKLPRK